VHDGTPIASRRPHALRALATLGLIAGIALLPATSQGKSQHRSHTPVAHAAAYAIYCDAYVAGYSTCSDGRAAYVSFDYDNAASYGGGGYISVCERVDVSGAIANRVCNPTTCYCNYASSGTQSNYQGQTHYFYVGNNSPNTHTIHGRYDTDF